MRLSEEQERAWRKVVEVTKEVMALDLDPTPSPLNETCLAIDTERRLLLDVATAAREYLESLEPDEPPMLDSETIEQYTDRLTGADRTGRRPHPDRNRQCSIGYHDECSDPTGDRCGCPCHKADKRARALRTALAALNGKESTNANA